MRAVLLIPSLCLIILGLMDGAVGFSIFVTLTTTIITIKIYKSL
jgi:hypothetical protein